MVIFSMRTKEKILESTACKPYRRATGEVSFEQTFSALKYPNYRLWFWGQMASLAGTWMQTTAQGFLMYELTQSPAMLGWVGFAGGIPFWFFNFIGGVITDRYRAAAYY